MSLPDFLFNYFSPCSEVREQKQGYALEVKTPGSICNCTLKIPGFWIAASNWMMFFIQDKEKKSWYETKVTLHFFENKIANTPERSFVALQKWEWKIDNRSIARQR